MNWRALAIIGLSAAVIVWRTRDRRQLRSALDELKALRKAPTPAASKSPASGRTIHPARGGDVSLTVVERVVEGAAGDRLIIEGRAYRRGELTPFGALLTVRGLCGVAIGYDRRLVLLFPKIGESQPSEVAGGSGSPEYATNGRRGLPPLE